MAKFISVIAGTALIAAGLVLEFVTFGESTPLTAFLISAGAGMVITGIGTLLSGKPPLPGSTASRNPIEPWNVIYGRKKVGGTLVYFSEFGDNDKYLDLVFVLACHPCEAVDELRFDNQRIQIDASTGSSFTPVQQTVDIFHISRANNVVTVVLHADIPLLEDGDMVTISGVTGDLTVNGTFPVTIISQVYLIGTPGSITFSYLSGGLPSIVDLEGTVTTKWADYGKKVHMEVLLGNHVATFPGMLHGTPSDGDVGDPVNYFDNPWNAQCLLLGRTAVFLRLHYNDAYFVNGMPSISFLVRGKNDILDPRTSPYTYGYTENAALCVADHLSNVTWGFKAAYGTEIPILPLIAAANNCDEPVALAAGGTEPRYACNGGFPLTASRGEVLQNLLTACGGRISYAGGQFIIYPAAWPGVSLTVVPYRTELPC